MFGLGAAEILPLVIASAGVLVFLHTLGKQAARERAVHDLRVECITLRNNYVRRLNQIGDGLDPADLGGTGKGEFDIID